MGLKEPMAIMSDDDDDDKGGCLTKAELDKAGGFDPIPDLKPGDKLKWKGKEYKTAVYPDVGEVIEVIETLDPPLINTVGPYEREDFLFAAKGKGKIVLFTLDSRRFVRV